MGSSTSSELRKHLMIFLNKHMFAFVVSYRYRQYGLWDRYTDIHPESDQVFSIGISDSKKEWFFAHVDRS